MVPEVDDRNGDAHYSVPGVGLTRNGETNYHVITVLRDSTNTASHTDQERTDQERGEISPGVRTAKPS